MATQLFERDEPEEPRELLRRPEAAEARAVVVEDRLAAAAVRLEADFLAGDFLVRALPDADFFAAGRELDFLAADPREPLEADFLAVDPPELLEADFLAVDLPELLEADFFAVEPEADFFAVEPAVDFLAVEPEVDFLAVDPEVDFLAVDPEVGFFAVEPEADFFAVEDERWRFTLPSWISPSQPSTSSCCSRAWLATNRR